MSEYYAVQRSDSSLKHYGIRGMKWGVRKAIQSRNSVRVAKKLSKQYAKASKKLAKLEKKADVNYQSAKSQKYGKISKIAGKVGIAGLATGIGTGAGSFALAKSASNLGKIASEAQRKNKSGFFHISNSIYDRHSKKYFSDYDKVRKNIDLRNTKHAYEVKDAKLANLGKNASTAHNTAQDRLLDTYKTNRKTNGIETAEKRLNAARNTKRIAGIAGIIGAAGLGVSAASAIRSRNAKRLATQEGHTKAVAKRDAWKKEMQSAFKGTKYASLPKNTGTNRQGRKRRKTT